ncbi:MAG: iron uptake porin, partial [Cyanobacteria bacterium J06638_38]
MFKLVRNLLLASPAMIGLVLGSQLSAVAQSNANSNTELLNQINSYSQEGRNNSRSQVTNVNQLRDVSPTDWAYEALRSLVDRYGCIAGFPNQTYRGNQPLSRYEFAAGLNSCLNQIERLIASQGSVSSEDLDAITRLSQEFEAELATVGGRVDELESRTAVLEDSQFSTTTKLEGEVVFGVSSEFNNTDFNETVFQDRVRLNFV